MFKTLDCTCFATIEPFKLKHFNEAIKQQNFSVLKAERLQKKRLDAFIKTKDPKLEYQLPENKPKFDMRGIEFTFSFNSGIQWKVRILF